MVIRSRKNLEYTNKKNKYNFDAVTGEKLKEHNPQWPQIFDHPYRVLIVDGPGKTHALLNLIKQQPKTDKIFLHSKDPFESKYQYYKSIEKYNSGKERKALIVFDDMIDDTISNKDFTLRSLSYLGN